MIDNGNNDYTTLKSTLKNTDIFQDEKRYLIAQGIINVFDQKQKSITSNHLILLNDLLVIFNIAENNQTFSNPKIFDIEKVSVELFVDSLESNVFQITCLNENIIIFTMCYVEAVRWCRSINLRSKLIKLNLGIPTKKTEWIPDNNAVWCMTCQSSFTVINRRHHCRKCGFVVCDECSKHRAIIKRISVDQKLRICNKCYTKKVNHVKLLKDINQCLQKIISTDLSVTCSTTETENINSLSVSLCETVSTEL
ncbi:Lysosome-associated apoptosis-inducing protein containing PH and FYVE domains [Intoshia linei]|uniref:Lysosome-associated apoptosis-inducing protein containing PH and FYVE domains n=1 Tax=Intoshia linei TaxID=1819745 RepID=A0A177B5H1_9BILA|nr:Lysosome-associated apoptosis-inducing protein containing PH and FYVE domains [Intoshia linei]